jgi:hypothetical protein
MKILRWIVKWFLIACAVSIGMGLLNRWHPSVGLGDVVFFSGFAIWLSKGILDDTIAQLNLSSKK